MRGGSPGQPVLEGRGAALQSDSALLSADIMTDPWQATGSATAAMAQRLAQRQLRASALADATECKGRKGSCLTTWAEDGALDTEAYMGEAANVIAGDATLERTRPDRPPSRYI